MKFHLSALAAASFLFSAAADAQLANKFVPASEINVPRSVDAALQSDNRPAEEKAKDANRKPGAVMTFFGIESGDKVAELLASGGYYVGVLSEIVGPDGTVYGQNNGWIMQRQDDGRSPIAKRIETHGLTNVVDLVSEFENPNLPQGELDAVFVVLIYHDMLGAFKTDTAAMNKAIMSALKPGGVYGIIDHHAAPGTGLSATSTQHRVERHEVVQDILDAGFVLEAGPDLVRNTGGTTNELGVVTSSGEAEGRNWLPDTGRSSWRSSFCKSPNTVKALTSRTPPAG